MQEQLAITRILEFTSFHFRTAENEKDLKERKPLVHRSIEFAACALTWPHTRVHEHEWTNVIAKLERKCDRVCSRARANPDRFARTHSEEEEERNGKQRLEEEERGGGRESYMKITYSLGPALKRPRTYNRRQLKASHTSMPGS